MGQPVISINIDTTNNTLTQVNCFNERGRYYGQIQFEFIFNSIDFLHNKKRHSSEQISATLTL